jgi:hypothetical protein
MSAALAAPADAVSPITGEPIPAECLQAARNFRQRIMLEDTAFINALDQLIAPIKARHDRKPTPRAEMIAGLRRQWQAIGQYGRIMLNCADKTQLKHGLGLCDLRVYPAQLHDKAWEDNYCERGLAVGTVVLVWQPRNLQLRMSTIVNVSMHSLGRFFERCPDPCLAALYASFGEIVCASPKLFADDEAFELETHWGRWRGVVYWYTENGERHQMLGVRTYKEPAHIKLLRNQRRNEGH